MHPTLSPLSRLLHTSVNKVFLDSQICRVYVPQLARVCNGSAREDIIILARSFPMTTKAKIKHGIGHNVTARVLSKQSPSIRN